MKNKIKVGSIVKALAGPHKGDEHKVISIKGNSYNITPVNRNNVKYKMGAAKATANQIELIKEDIDEEESPGFDTKEELIAFLKDNFGEDVDIDDLTEGLLNELTPAEKKLIDKMYDKKGNLTPLGKKVMNHGKKPGDKGYIEEATEIYKNKDLSIKRWTMGFDTKGNRISGFAIGGGKIGKISAKDNLVQLTKPQIQQLAKDMKKIISYMDASDEMDENKTLDEGLRHLKTANFKKGMKLFNDIMGHFKLGGRLNKELEDASDGELNKKYDEMYKHLRMAGEIFDDLEADVKFIESVDLEELDLSIDKFVAVAKGTKTKNKFFVFNNKGQVYHTAPTLDKAKKLRAEYKKNPEEMGTATILDLTKGKIVESVELEENAEVARITKIAKSLKVGNKTTFGVVTKMGDDWIEFKAKDTPKTKIKFNQRKSGKRYVLSLLALAESNNETTPDISRAFTSSKDSLAQAAKEILNKRANGGE